MSVAERARARRLGARAEHRLSGWGRTTFSRARVVRAQSHDEVVALLGEGAGSRDGVLARGAGRCYGDAAQVAGGTVLDLTGLADTIEIDRVRKLVRVDAGVTYAQLLGHLIPAGLMIPVIPGTRHVTLGGAIASDVHGKNHPADGSIAGLVEALTLVTPGGRTHELTAESGGELLAATLGGLGLTGVVTSATLRVESLAAPGWLVDTDRTDSLEQTLALMSRDEGHRYNVAWLDLLVRGAHSGRAVVTRSRDAQAGELPSEGAPREDLSHASRVTIPPGFPGWVLQPPAIAAFNSLRWRAFPRHERGKPVAAEHHFFPLDGFGAWNRLYGAHGLFQYQFVVGDGHADVLIDAVRLLAARRVPVFLAVLKRLGEADGSPLSFPMPGWTLALDIPAGAAGARQALDTLDERVAECGGRVYLTKDVRLRRDLLEAMYPELGRFRAARELVDPDGVMRSDLGQRLGLCGPLR
jgi:decaprenylphospho-beta-D-ribofuranose 2-oxidase